MNFFVTRFLDAGGRDGVRLIRLRLAPLRHVVAAARSARRPALDRGPAVLGFVEARHGVQYSPLVVGRDFPTAPA